MTKVTYRDETIEGQDAIREITSCGVKFVRGVPREVPPRLLPKFIGNRFFEVEGHPYVDKSGFTSAELEIDNSDNAVKGEEYYTVEELTEILNKKGVKIPASAKEDADALMVLVEKNGGL